MQLLLLLLLLLRALRVALDVGRLKHGRMVVATAAAAADVDIGQVLAPHLAELVGSIRAGHAYVARIDLIATNDAAVVVAVDVVVVVVVVVGGGVGVIIGEVFLVAAERASLVAAVLGQRVGGARVRDEVALHCRVVHLVIVWPIIVCASNIDIRMTYIN